MWRPGEDIRFLPLLFSTLFLTLTESEVHHVPRLTSQQVFGIQLFLLPNSGVLSSHCQASFLCGCLGFKLRFSCFHENGSLFTEPSPQPQLSIFWMVVGLFTVDTVGLCCPSYRWSMDAEKGLLVLCTLLARVPECLTLRIQRLCCLFREQAGLGGWTSQTGTFLVQTPAWYNLSCTVVNTFA